MTSGAGRYELDLWRAAQLRHFLYTLLAPDIFECNLLPFEEYCTERGRLSHTLSQPPEDFQVPYQLKWEMDLDRTFLEEPRTKIIQTLRFFLCVIGPQSFFIDGSWALLEVAGVAGRNTGHYYTFCSRIEGFRGEGQKGPPFFFFYFLSTFFSFSLSFLFFDKGKKKKKKGGDDLKSF